MISSLSHCLIFAAGIAATIVSAPGTTPRPKTIGTGATPVTIEAVADYFAPPTAQEIDDFAARSPMFEA